MQTQTGYPTCWVFACYVRERTQAIALFDAGFFSKENVISRVRDQLKIPELIDVNNVDAGGWDAPAIQLAGDRFICDMDEIDSKVNAYLVNAGYHPDQPKNAMKTTMPYLNAGVLLVIVNVLPYLYYRA